MLRRGVRRETKNKRRKATLVVCVIPRGKPRLFTAHIFYTNINHLFVKISAFPYDPEGNQTQRHRDDLSKMTG